MGMGGCDFVKCVKVVLGFYVVLVIVILGGLLLMLGGVLICDNSGVIVGVVGVSGDMGDNDEIVVIVGIEVVGLSVDFGKSE